MILKIDLHTHTRRYSACSRLSPEALCETALARGLDALAITEHHQQWSPDEIAELQSRYPALKLYAGVEITCTDGHDYVILGRDPGAYAEPMPYADLQTLLETHPGAFVFVAHCFRFSTDERGLAERALDGIEVGSCNTLARQQPPHGPAAIEHEALYQRWQQRMGWIPLYNSDAHSTTAVGTFCNVLDVADGMPAGELALAEVLRTAPLRPLEDPERIRAHMYGRIRARIWAAIGTIIGSAIGAAVGGT